MRRHSRHAPTAAASGVASPAPGRQSFRSPLQDCRRPRLPGVAGLAPRERSPGACPSPAEKIRNPFRHAPLDQPRPPVSSPRSPLSSRLRRPPKIGRVTPTHFADHRRGEDTAGRDADAYIHDSIDGTAKRGRRGGRIRIAESRESASPAPSQQPRRQRPPRPRSGWPLPARGRGTSRCWSAMA